MASHQHDRPMSQCWTNDSVVGPALKQRSVSLPVCWFRDPMVGVAAEDCWTVQNAKDEHMADRQTPNILCPQILAECCAKMFIHLRTFDFLATLRYV